MASSPAPAAAAAAETLADYELPQTVVGRIVKNVLPSYMQIGKETRAAFTKVFGSFFHVSVVWHRFVASCCTRLHLFTFCI
jgi:hypothetical protein